MDNDIFPGVRVGPSQLILGEKGVLSTRSFQPHDTIFEVRGPIVKKRTKYSFQLGPDEHIDPFEDGVPGFGYYLNHSCEPSAYIRIRTVSAARRLYVCARRIIHPGEEIATDYATMEFDLTVAHMPCQCRAKTCRGVMIGFKDLSPDQRQRYIDEGIVPKHLIDQLG